MSYLSSYPAHDMKKYEHHRFNQLIQSTDSLMGGVCDTFSTSIHLLRPCLLVNTSDCSATIIDCTYGQGVWDQVEPWAFALCSSESSKFYVSSKVSSHSNWNLWYSVVHHVQATDQVLTNLTVRHRCRVAVESQRTPNNSEKIQNRNEIIKPNFCNLLHVFSMCILLQNICGSWYLPRGFADRFFLLWGTPGTGANCTDS